MRGCVRFAVLAALCGVAFGAQAQTAVPSFELEQLQLNPSARGSLFQDTGLLLKSGAFRVSLLGHYQRDPLLAFRGEEKVGALVSDRVTAQLQAAYGVADWFEFGFQLPLVAFQQGDDLTSFGVASPESLGLGTPQLYARAQLISQEGGGPLNVAVGVGAGFPVGSEAALGRNDGFSFTPELAASREVDHFLLSLNAAFLYRNTVRVGSTDVGPQFNVGGAVAYLNEGGVQPELSVRGLLPTGEADPALEVMVGARYPIVDGLEVFGAAGPGFGGLPGSPSFRALLGLAYGSGGTPPPPPVSVCDAGQPQPVDQCPDLDKDGDGVRNANDRCPMDAEDKDGFEDADGCPDNDNDGDGIADAQDKCANEKGEAKYDGCPPPDRDKDGVLDADDACPDEAGLVERKGCPFRDKDGDGIEDSVDACPTEAGPPETRGCAVKDTDGDTVPDHLDNCPNEKGDPKNAGCPKKQKQLVVITRERLVIKDKVYFATGKSKVLPRSFLLLDQIAKIVKEHPEIPKVLVEGHTDNRGSAELNRKLSQDRANAVRDYLVGKGVDPKRLDAIGHGPDKPADTNDTAKGREANRRVEFNIVDQPPQTEVLGPATGEEAAPETAPAPAPATDAGEAGTPPATESDAGTAAPGADAGM